MPLEPLVLERWLWGSWKVESKLQDMLSDMAVFAIRVLTPIALNG